MIVDREKTWEELQARILGMPCEPGLGPVGGSGDPHAALVLVGEAPGEVEVREGRPFVGPAGRLLDRALESAGLSRSAVWTTNVVKCRPVQGEGRVLRNRAPTAAEIRLWRPLLEEELRLIAPQVLLCLGAVAAKALLDPKFSLQRQRGQWLPGPFGTAAMATFHPAYLFRLEGEARDAATAALDADLRAVRARLDEQTIPA
jgi:uracil-DNA glycosylase family 4